MIEDWLLVAIVVIAATDTRAGRRVLLFGLPGRFGKASAVGPAPAMMPSPEGLLAGLIEVAGAVARFERTVEAHAAEPGFCPHAAADKTPTGPGSDHRLIPKSARQMPCGHRPGCRRQMPTATGVDRFSTVIVLVDPYGSDSMPPGIMWSDLVAQSGPRAFFTRRGASEGRWSPSAAVWCRPGMVADWRGFPQTISSVARRRSRLQQQGGRGKYENARHLMVLTRQGFGCGVRTAIVRGCYLVQVEGRQTRQTARYLV